MFIMTLAEVEDRDVEKYSKYVLKIMADIPNKRY